MDVQREISSTITCISEWLEFELIESSCGKEEVSKSKIGEKLSPESHDNDTWMKLNRTKLTSLKGWKASAGLILSITMAYSEAMRAAFAFSLGLSLV